MKRYLLLSLIFLTFSVQSQAAKVYLFYGKIKPIQENILKRVFIEKAKKDFSQYPNIEFEIIKKSDLKNLLSAIQSPETLGVLYFGHPSLVTEGEVTAAEDKRKILNGFLQVSDGKYIPKSILSAAHPNLQFVSFMTCHQSEVLKKYLSYKDKTLRFYRAPETNSAGGENPLFEFTSYYNTPKILDEIIKDMDLHVSTFQNERKTELKNTSLDIEYRDLLSSRFSYEVLLDGKLVGILESQKTKRGRKLNRQTYSVRIGEGKELIIQQDDLNRKSKANQKNIIDDILIDSIKVNSEEQLNSPLHLGDESKNSDQGIGLSYLRNQDDFEATPVIRQWRYEL